MNPTEHDIRLLELMQAHAAAAHRLAQCSGTIRSTTDPRSQSELYRNWKPVPDPRPFAEALKTLTDAIEAGVGYDAKYSWPNYLERYNDAAKAETDAVEALILHEQNYTGWDRFWLVMSSPGHVHSSRNCSSCKWTTTYALVPDLSNSSASDAVAMFGAAMCTVCFPSAPTGAKIAKALAESVGTDAFAKNLAKHQAKNGIA